jgi:tripartite-type tricarboxylate transporter receptor subunit TctC
MRALALAMIAAALCLAGQAGAEDYPAHSVRMLIPAAPGGAVDVIGRVLADKMSATLGKPVVPENRAGAGTMVGSEALVNSPADGYTILVMTSSHAINAAVQKTIRFDPLNSFAPVSLVATVPDLLVVNAASPIHSLADLIQAAKKEPGKITYGSAGAGSYSQMDAELLKTMAGIDMLHVPYKGGVPSVAALLGNEIQCMFLSAPGLVPHVKAGKLRALAVTSKQRSPLLPDVPTMAEAGLPDYSATSWYGVVLPAKTPPAIIATLNKHINEALKMPDVRAKLAAVGVETVGTTPDYFGGYLRDDIARWRKLVEKNPKLRIQD